MDYLIDGYNLMHALGLLPQRLPPDGLRRARLRLLGLLKGGHGAEAAHVTVVFDARRAPPGAPAEEDVGGVRAVYAVGRDEADDLLEELIRQAAVPKSLTVVSDDNRVRAAARRRRCAALGCEAYISYLEKRRSRRPKKAAPGEKPTGVSRADLRHWLAAFSDLADDPDAKELFDPFGFLSDESR